ncbi:Alpha-L-glycero-D-manno-heptose beta-1,4-glucosyltransferase [Candidatus Glomeribacter gigasporarum BEG34]|uniref:Alpha-L-glycero-D-manno-heptose beta-1,4-glucosyltransferase n=1 Tax=Candidatus Glomeribacter gigasporarum BEG34 TaxID=1070319 RepID=G2J8V4_9BURK|nr:glycosyltransferase family 2 protein [Candidatus Glomeribacter gigasporarum]CCD29201.1 Alpha-L-glycero-D-manno-heptose beta-1,4-glucosyltransferase [Candidatus Glomeribacter gigasporarum BEG34]
MPGKLRLSVIIITLNEAHHITECIDSIKSIASEIIVLDCGSEDETQALARAHGARVMQNTGWPGFGPQKNRALARAQFAWILSLDADERATPALCAEIARAVRNEGYTAYAIPRRTQFCGRWVRHSGWTPDDVVQLFRRGQARFSEHAVHEHVRVEGSIGHLTQPLEHYSYRSQREVNEKVQRYARAGAQELHRAGIRGGFCKALLHGGWAWWRTFIWRLGFLDGWTGWAIAAMNARTAWLKYKYLGAARGAAPTSAAVRNS